MGETEQASLITQYVTKIYFHPVTHFVVKEPSFYSGHSPVITWNRELILKFKLKCYVKPMKDPLGVSPSKGNQGTTRGKKNSFNFGGNRNHDLRIRSTVTLPTELRGQTEKVGGDLCGESRRRESKGTYECCAA